ncbi:MAG: fibronectin type III domain-containing protein, partial [Planctomycetes bacterium]|nr:fibronectin type III domain-containing protein [Planctomycetota bacterium]
SVIIPSSGGTGKIRLYGKLTMPLEIERTFDGDSTATVFTTDGPITLVNGQGDRVLGIGTTRAFDAAGDVHDCDVQYTKVADGFTFIVTVPATWLGGATYPIRIDPIIGKPEAISKESARADFESQCAFGAGQYFVVWTSKATAAIAVSALTTSGEDVYARRVAPDGTFIGPTFAVATGSTLQRKPHVAFASAGGGVFGVALRDGNLIVFKRYSPTGALLSVSTINDPALSNRVTTVDIASNGTDRFCITWTGFLAGSTFHQTWAEVRGADGSVITSDTPVGPASGTSVHARPSVVWNSTLSQWFFTWEAYDDAIAAAPKQVSGRAFDATLGTAAFAEILVSTDPGSNYDARIAWSATSNEYLVTFDNNPPTGKTNVHGRRVRATDGVLLGSEFSVETNTKASSDSSVAWIPNSNRWVTVFDLAGGGMRGAYGQALLADGTPTGPLFVLSDDPEFGEIQPTLARNGSLDQFLATWTDGSATVQDIWGARLDLTPPAAPGPITTSNGSSSITLTWPKGTDSDLRSYLVYRATAAGGPYGTGVAVLPPVGATVSYTDTAVSVNTRYFYVVRAIDTHANVSDASAVASESIDTIPPAPPTGLAATPGDTTVALTWSPNAETDLGGYNVYYRATGATTWITANGTPLALTSFTVTGLIDGTSYDFTVTALETEPTESAGCAVVAATPVDGTAPAAPTGLVAVAGNRSVSLTWDTNSEGDLAGYYVYRAATVGGSFLRITSSVVGSPAYSDIGLTNDTPYFYKVMAVDSSTNESTLSSAAGATPRYPTPSGLTLDSTTDTGATFHWSEVTGVSDLLGYNVWRSGTSGSGYAKLTPSPISGTTFTDSGLTPGTYYYVVTAKATGGDESSNSNEISAVITGGTPPGPPTLDASNTRKTNDNTPRITGLALPGYVVNLYEGLDFLGAGTADGTTGVFEIFTTVTLADRDHIIQASQQASSGSTASGLSSGRVVTIDTVPPAAPSGVRVLGGDGWVEVSWNANKEPDLLGYNVYRRVAAGAWEQLNSKPLLNLKYLDKPVTNGTAYEYRVGAVDNAVDEN